MGDSNAGLAKRFYRNPGRAPLNTGNKLVVREGDAKV
jgi:hypothetical protein